MRKLFLFAIMTIIAVVANEARAESKNYYAKCTVEVAEDSKGLGTVYIHDNISDEEVTELTAYGSDAMQMGGANVGFSMRSHPADGYVLVNFTDQYNNVYKWPNEDPGTNPDLVVVWATSEDESDPTVFNLYAHFVEESLLPKGELAEVTVPANEKFGTFMAPVAAEIPADIKAYRVIGIENDMLVLSVVEGEYLDAFTPVLLENLGMFDATISASYEPEELPEELPSMTAGLLTGVMEEELLAEGVYNLEPNYDTESSDFVKVTDGMTFIKPYHAYLTAEGDAAETITIDTNNTSISTILNDLRNDEIYDLNGRRIERLQKGINIVGGVKIMVK